MRGDNRSDPKEGLTHREREGTSFPCRSHPNAPQAKPVSLGSIKSTGGVESAPGTIQRFVVKTRRIRRIVPREPSSSDTNTAENEVSELGPEVDSTSNEDEFESRIGVKSSDMKSKVSGISNNIHSDEESLGEKDSYCGPSENGPHDADLGDVNHNRREATSGAISSNRGSSSGGNGRSDGAGKSYDLFDECDREEQEWDLNENGIGEADPWTDDEEEEGGDLSDAAKFMSSIRKCAKVTEREEKYRGRDFASGCPGSDHRMAKDDSSYCSKGATVKSKYSTGGEEAAFDRHCPKKSARSRHYSDSRSAMPKTMDDSNSSNVEYEDRPSYSISRHSASDNTETVLPPPQLYSTGTGSHRNTNNKLCYGAEGSSNKGSNSTKPHNLKDQTVLLHGRHVGDICHSSGSKEDFEWRRNDMTTGTRPNTIDRSHGCNYSEELDSGKVVSHRAGDKIRGDVLPEHVLRRRSNNNNDRTENDPTSRVGTKVPQSHDKQNRRKFEATRSCSSSPDNVKQGRDGCSSRHWDQSPLSSPVTATAHSLPKTVTFAKSVKSADDDREDDEDDDEDDVDETDEDVYEDSTDECSSVREKVQSSLSKRGGGTSKVAGESYKSNRTKRGVVSIVKHHTVSTAGLDNDISTITGPSLQQQRPLHPSVHYIGAAQVFTHHLHRPGVSTTHSGGGGSAKGSATSKRRYLSLPLLEQDSSEVDSSSSTDISPGDSSGSAGPSGGGSCAVPVYPGTRLLNPGEVYYFAPNSCVVCVERNKLAPTRIQVSIVLWVEYIVVYGTFKKILNEVHNR